MLSQSTTYFLQSNGSSACLVYGESRTAGVAPLEGGGPMSFSMIPNVAVDGLVRTSRDDIPL